MRTLGWVFCLLLLTGCSRGAVGSLPLAPEAKLLDASPTGQPPGNVAKFKTIYSFKGYSDGENPEAGVIEVNGALYGTTAQSDVNCKYGCGTAFKITMSGTKKVLYRFRGGDSDGAGPLAAFTLLDGTLFGTTSGGGGGQFQSDGSGTVFSLATAGTEHVLHTFGRFSAVGLPDGMNPEAGLTDVNGTLVGTTTNGGNGYGTVFATTPSGKETVLYRFTGGSDGAGPTSNLVDVDGTLYGTTGAGGTSDRGTVFSVTMSGKESVLYSFKGRPDGARPWAGLTYVNGTLFGVTTDGGKGFGTVFKVSMAGAETVIHRFYNGDGAIPVGGLIAVGGKLYGTTADGGGSGCVSGYGCGTVFEMTTSGTETVLHRFTGSDGSTPSAALFRGGNNLYGTTFYGGINNNCGYGCGVVFSLTL